MFIDLPPEFLPPEVEDVLCDLHKFIKKTTDWSAVQITFNHLDFSEFVDSGLQVHVIAPTEGEE